MVGLEQCLVVLENILVVESCLGLLYWFMVVLESGVICNGSDGLEWLR